MENKEISDLGCYTLLAIRLTLRACISSEYSQVEHKSLEMPRQFMVDDPKLRDQTCSSPLMWFSRVFQNAERCVIIIFLFATWKFEGTRACPEGGDSMLQQHHQPNSRHGTLQETSPWLNVRNSWGLTRQTHSTAGKVGQPSSAWLAKARNPKLNNSGLTSLPLASTHLPRPIFPET